MTAGESESTSHRAVGASMVEGIDFVRCRICGDIVA
jgi:hypothetical protein